MTMAQVWSAIGILATAFAGMIALVSRAMSAQRREHTAEIRGTHEKIDGVAATLNEKIDGSVTGLNEKIDGLDAALNAKIDGSITGLNEKIDGRFAVLCEKIDGLRNEMVARFQIVEKLSENVDRLDRDVQAITIKVFGNESPEQK